MTYKNTRRGKTQQDVYKNCHSRGSLSGIYNASCCKTRQKNLLNGVRGRSPIPTFGDDAFFDNGGFTPYRHAECITASSRYNNKTLKQVQGDGMRGFTLIELLVVVLIIGILAAVAVPQYQKAVAKARAAHMLMYISNLQKAMDIYLLEYGDGEYNKPLVFDYDAEEEERLANSYNVYVWDHACGGNAGCYIAFPAAERTDEKVVVWLEKSEYTSWQWSGTCTGYDLNGNVLCETLKKAGKVN